MPDPLSMPKSALKISETLNKSRRIFEGSVAQAWLGEVAIRQLFEIIDNISRAGSVH